MAHDDSVKQSDHRRGYDLVLEVPGPACHRHPCTDSSHMLRRRLRQRELMLLQRRLRQGSARPFWGGDHEVGGIVLALGVGQNAVLREGRHPLGPGGEGLGRVPPALAATKRRTPLADHAQRADVLEVVLCLRETGDVTRALFRAQDPQVRRGHPAREVEVERRVAKHHRGGEREWALVPRLDQPQNGVHGDGGTGAVARHHNAKAAAGHAEQSAVRLYDRSVDVDNFVDGKGVRV
jgi:hypothetical protein